MAIEKLWDQSCFNNIKWSINDQYCQVLQFVYKYVLKYIYGADDTEIANTFKYMSKKNLCVFILHKY